jgi:hypothetical protein
MLFYNLRKIWNPEWFQGNTKRRNYFEGWYFKMVSEDLGSVIAVIPGISITESRKDAISFVQVINGINGETVFIKYPFDAFSHQSKPFGIRIDKNSFSDKEIFLDLEDSEFSLSGKVQMGSQVPYPVKIFSPGVMGWYRFVPTMECYHGIVSMQHHLQGSLRLNGTNLDFNGGRGYIEKDWGKSMPHAWIWMQCNHFSQENLSVSISIANIPWKKSAFTGFLIILSMGSEFFRFTTYTGAKIKQLKKDENLISFRVENSKYILDVRAEGSEKGILKAPVLGEMSRNIHESIGAGIKLKLSDRNGNILVEDSGKPAGLEIAGDTADLISKLNR